MLERSIWSLYSKTARQMIREKRHANVMLQESSDTLLVLGQGGSLLQGSFVNLSFLFSKKNGQVEACSYSLFGNERLVLLCESGCSFCVQKTYRQLETLTGENLLYHLQKVLGPLTATALSGYINIFLDGLVQACECCSHLPCQVVTPCSSLSPPERYIEDWDQLPQEDRLHILEDILETQIRPFLKLDSGNIRIISLDTPFHLRIAYEGSCVGCLAAYGSTLGTIQTILKKGIHPSLGVSVEETKEPFQLHPESSRA
ncbi:NifU family protein [Candidatus Similichlamydia laticola]|uniref:NIF system FeS cluster assembly NifU C-terminal domain-containing protein n=1 Tax=Candidatus Similichlamydia laticola TaxID=2170265 RepID=A0A369KHA1_9BACT|nr:NifU family protein [Candidatus Similichlamydia laticola]RDB31134.1 hypothetical protein HAT2_00764 [Candidatus Similichlamydia laticola]